jgi:Holliday junction DNA helicase RuvA
MLAYLQGVIKDRQNGEMILVTGSEAHGWVGYQVKTPDHPRYEVFIPGQKAEVYLYTHVREDALDLFGFRSATEKNLFMTLLQVSGVGPKMALSLLSHTDEANLIQMIISEDKEGLTGISGVGKKTAERMILELKDVIAKKMDAGILSAKGASGKVAQPGSKDGSGIDRLSPLFVESYLALQGLGYKDATAREMVDAVFKAKKPVTTVEEVVKYALQGNFGT